MTPFRRVALRAGRPSKSAAEKRRANSLRQHRFRERRKAELAALRKLQPAAAWRRASERARSAARTGLGM